MKSIFQSLMDIFYPKNCLTCAKVLIKYEEILCFYCERELPFTNYCNTKDNEVEKIFFGRVAVYNATALLHFNKKGHVQKMIHELKYRGNQQIGTYLGRILGDEIVLSERFLDLDCILTIPISKQKIKQRGYNQTTTFGRELSNRLKIPYYEDLLVANAKRHSQTILSRFDRIGELENKFLLLNGGILYKKHILLVDDVVTTGATLEACTFVLQKVEGVKISIALMAITD